VASETTEELAADAPPVRQPRVRSRPELRSGRTLLVIGANSLLIFWLVRVESPVARSAVLAVPLVLGIVLELAAPRAARFVNVGFYSFVAISVTVGLALAALGVHGLSEPEHVVVAWILGALPCGLLAILMNWLYKVTEVNDVGDGRAA